MTLTAGWLGWLDLRSAALICTCSGDGLPAHLQVCFLSTSIQTHSISLSLSLCICFLHVFSNHLSLRSLYLLHLSCPSCLQRRHRLQNLFLALSIVPGQKFGRPKARTGYFYGTSTGLDNLAQQPDQFPLRHLTHPPCQPPIEINWSLNVTGFFYNQSVSLTCKEPEGEVVMKVRCDREDPRNGNYC